MNKEEKIKLISFLEDYKNMLNSFIKNTYFNYKRKDKLKYNEERTKKREELNKDIKIIDKIIKELKENEI